jgi:hypothetical protein
MDDRTPSSSLYRALAVWRSCTGWMRRRREYDRMNELAAQFETHRTHLRAVAYRILVRTFSGRAQAADLALVNGSPGAVWAPGGRPRVVFSCRRVWG